tara:strand:- start:475 stop:741 length:267 start_codon:yes stop_codon:yes gene_type:complete
MECGNIGAEAFLKSILLSIIYSMSDALKNREVIVEMVPMGQVMRVSAMDTATLTEIIISGPVNSPQALLQSNALKRLEYVLRKKGIIG